MSAVTEHTTDTFVMPATVVTRVDLSRLVREAERVDNEYTAVSVREKIGAKGDVMPAMSEQLLEFLEKNKIEFGKSKERSRVVKQLRKLKDSAPTIHMTFAVEADIESLQRLATWVRESIHPQAIIDVGLQPGLIGGVYLRTENHVHDLSLRGKLQAGRSILVKELEALRVNG